jgi:hypothetical protein
VTSVPHNGCCHIYSDGVRWACLYVVWLCCNICSRGYNGPSVPFLNLQKLVVPGTEYGT